MVHGHMVNSVVLVSTKNAGADSIEPNLIHHKDYYIHDLSDVLFKNRDTTRGVGEKRPPALVNIIKGQNVYNVYLKHDNDTLTNDPHYTSRQKAHQMANYFGLDTMRTISEWFDIKLLSALDKTTHDGIRIYFVRHKTQYTYRGLIKQTPTQDPDSLKEAFFIIPTIPYGNSGTKHKDNLAAKKSLDELIKSNFYNSKRFSIVRPMIDTIGGDDNGSLCPTNCNSN